MVEVQKIDPSMIAGLDGLLRELDPKLTATDWERTFHHTWTTEEDYCGYGLFANGEPVGFLGLIFSRRMINNKPEAFCNITSWIIRKEHRGHGLSLIQPVLKLKEYTLTDLTPSSTVFKLLRRLGFEHLDTRLKMLLPGDNRGSRAAGEGRDTVFRDERDIARQLNDADRKLLKDHSPYGCGHLLICDGGTYCYLIYSKVQGALFPYGYIQYISNLVLFEKFAPLVRAEIARECRSWLVIVDSRLIGNVKLHRAINLPFKSPKLYRSDRGVRPGQIDNLYSELALLHLDTLPGLWEIKRELLGILVDKRYDPYPG